MFQRKVLTVDILSNYFKKYNIGLEVEEPRNSCEINQMFLDAYRIDEVFGSFVLKTVINFEKTGIKTVFSSYEDIEESYIQFLIGYSKTTNN